MTTTQTAAARRVSYQLATLWDFDYEPTHQELESLYETAKKNHCKRLLTERRGRQWRFGQSQRR